MSVKITNSFLQILPSCKYLKNIIWFPTLGGSFLLLILITLSKALCANYSVRFGFGFNVLVV